MMLDLLFTVQQAADPIVDAARHGNWGIGLGMGLAVIGAGIGLGWIGGSATQAIARQPEAANDIRGTALFIAFLMEGATIIGIIMALAAKIVG
jgi:F-type H+-transporting ATPase subunit c